MIKTDIEPRRRHGIGGLIDARHRKVEAKRQGEAASRIVSDIKKLAPQDPMGKITDYRSATLATALFSPELDLPDEFLDQITESIIRANIYPSSSSSSYDPRPNILKLGRVGLMLAQNPLRITDITDKDKVIPAKESSYASNPAFLTTLLRGVKTDLVSERNRHNEKLVKERSNYMKSLLRTRGQHAHDVAASTLQGIINLFEDVEFGYTLPGGNASDAVLFGAELDSSEDFKIMRLITSIPVNERNVRRIVGELRSKLPDGFKPNYNTEVGEGYTGNDTGILTMQYGDLVTISLQTALTKWESAQPIAATWPSAGTPGIRVNPAEMSFAHELAGSSTSRDHFASWVGSELQKTTLLWRDPVSTPGERIFQPLRPQE